jgi:hypothetical protein
VNGAEDHDRSADPQSDGGDDRHRHHRCSQQAPKTYAEVRYQIAKHQPALHTRLLLLILLPAVLPRAFQVSELPQRFATCRVE